MSCYRVEIERVEYYYAVIEVESQDEDSVHEVALSNVTTDDYEARGADETVLSVTLIEEK